MPKGECLKSISDRCPKIICQECKWYHLRNNTNDGDKSVSKANPLDRFVMLHVWIHSNAETGKPDSIDVFEIAGKVHMAWFAEALEDNNGPELASNIWKNPGKYSDYSEYSEDIYYRFLKFLWIVFPDGREQQLGKYVAELERENNEVK